MPFNNGLANVDDKIESVLCLENSESYKPAFSLVLDWTHMGSKPVPYENMGPSWVPCGLAERGILVL